MFNSQIPPPPEPDESANAHTFLTQGNVPSMASSSFKVEPPECSHPTALVPFIKLLFAVLERTLLDMRSTDADLVKRAKKWLIEEPVIVEVPWTLGWMLDQVGWGVHSVPYVRKYALEIENKGQPWTLPPTRETLDSSMEFTCCSLE